MTKSLIIVPMVAVSLVLMMACPSFASWYFDIQETSENVYEFLLVTDESFEFKGGTASFLYDNADTLEWTYTFSYPSPLMELFGSPYETESGDIDNLTGVAFANHPTVSETVVLATFAFTGTGDANLRFDMDDTTMKFEIDDVIYAAVDYPELYGSPVPIPAALWLFGSGLLSFFGLRRRKN